MEAKTKRIEAQMVHTAARIKGLMEYPKKTLEKQGEKDWQELSKEYTAFSKEEDLFLFDIDQFKDCVLSQDRKKLKTIMVNWQMAHNNSARFDQLPDKPTEQDVLMKLKHSNTRIAASFLLGFLISFGVIDL